MLTIKKRLFIEAYKKVKNGSEACRMAGYSVKSAGDAAHRLLKSPEIKRILSEWEKEECERLVPDIKTYQKGTFQREKECNHWPTRAKLWELGGRTMGYLQESPQRDANVINIICSELNLSAPGSKMLSAQDCDNVEQQEQNKLEADHPSEIIDARQSHNEVLPSDGS